MVYAMSIETSAMQTRNVLYLGKHNALSLNHQWSVCSKRSYWHSISYLVPTLTVNSGYSGHPRGVVCSP